MISAPAIAAPAAPAAPVVKETSASKTSADGSTFHALFHSAESESKPVESKAGQSKPGGQKNSAGQKKAAPKNPFAGEKTDDPTRIVLATVAAQPAEILDFGAPETPAQSDPGVPMELADAQTASKIVALIGTAPAVPAAEKSPIPMEKAQEQAVPKTGPAFGLELSTPKPANAAPPPPAQEPQPAAEQIPALLGPALAQVKAMSAEPAAEPKVEPAVNPFVSDPPQDAKPQASNPPGPPPRLERPSEVAPLEPARTPPTSSRDITVRLVDLEQRATDVRFVERGGQVHVSVRTSDAEFGRTLRGGLNDLITRLDHAGIRAELSRAGSDSASFRNHSRSSEDEQSGSRSGRDQRQRRQTSQPETWMEEYQQTISDGGQSQ